MKTETEITDYNEDNPGVRIQNNYDAEENVFASHGEAGQDISRIRCYTYNPNGWLTEVSDYISDEEITDSVVPSATTTYEYDDAGNRISRDTEGEVTTSQYNQHVSSETVDSSEGVTSNVSYSNF